VQLNFKYEPTGKIAENISSGDEFFENVFRRATNIYEFDRVRQRLFLLSRNIVRLQEYFCNWVLQFVDDREVDPPTPPSPSTRPGFPYTTKLIFGTASTGVQKIQY